MTGYEYFFKISRELFLENDCYKCGCSELCHWNFLLINLENIKFDR